MNALGHRGTEDGPKHVCVKKLLPTKTHSRSAVTSLQALNKHISAGLKRSAIIERITIQHFDMVNLHHINDMLKAAERAGVKAGCPRIKSQSCLAE